MFNRDELEKNLAINIGLMARNLQKAGINLSDLDKISNEALALIQNKSEQIAVNNPLLSQNVENIIIMVLMHGAIASQKEFINNTAKNLKVSAQMIEREMAKDTINR